MLEMWVLQAPCCHLSHGARQQSEMVAVHCGQPPVMKTTYRLIDCNKTIINLYSLNILPAPKIKVRKNHSKFWIRRKLAKRRTEKNKVFVLKKKFFLFCERSHHGETWSQNQIKYILHQRLSSKFNGERIRQTFECKCCGAILLKVNPISVAASKKPSNLLKIRDKGRILSNK